MNKVPAAASRFTRRTLLRSITAGVTAAALGPSRESDLYQIDSGLDRLPIDVAIVGAGVAGAYAAWRLMASEPTGARPGTLTARRKDGRTAVALFEMSDRVGGRLRSLAPPDQPHLRAELGAMRFPTSHSLVVSLVGQLGLETKPFPVSSGANLHYLRGRRLRQREWGQPDVLPYLLDPEDRRTSLDDLLIALIERCIPGARALTSQQWAGIRSGETIGGRRLCDASFWSVALHAKGIEVLNLIRDAGGYTSFYRGWNAAEMMAWIMADFLGSPTYLTLRAGYDALPKTLAARFVEAGGVFHPDHRLRRIRAESTTDLLTLEFEDDHGMPRPPRLARHVILALPPSALRLVRFEIPGVEIEQVVEAVVPQAAAKIFLVYPRPWWRELDIRGGRSTTDLPIRQCYYVGTEGDEPGANPTNRGSLLMASYHDDEYVTFWRTLGGARAPHEARWVSPSPEEPAMLEAHRQIGELHGNAATIPQPMAGLYVDWTQAPFGGGWHFWKVRQRPSDIIPRVQQPDPRTRLFLCGEAWSTDQGWVRGALRTAEQLVQAKFGLPPPSWLPEDERQSLHVNSVPEKEKAQ
jgi:monoamine oxidase